MGGKFIGSGRDADVSRTIGVDLDLSLIIVVGRAFNKLKGKPRVHQKNDVPWHKRALDPQGAVTRTKCRILAVSITMLVSACTLNDVRPLRDVKTPDSDRATVIYGLRVEAPWSAPEFGVSLDEYDLKRQAISGNCFRFNRMDASIPSVIGKTRYFEFDVKPGYYLYSAFNVTAPRNAALTSRAFAAPAGAIVYIGDFILGPGKRVDFRRDQPDQPDQPVSELDSIDRAKLADKVGLAESVQVEKARPFLCTP